MAPGKEVLLELAGEELRQNSPERRWAERAGQSGLGRIVAPGGELLAERRQAERCKAP